MAQILPYLLSLDNESILNCRRVNKLFYKIFDHEISWKYLFETNFNENIAKYSKIFCLENNKQIYIKYFKITKIIKKFYYNYQVSKLFDKKQLHLSNYPNRYDSQEFNISKVIGELINLETLCANYFSIESICQEIFQLVNLTSLKLNQNEIQILPKEIGLLTNLKELDLNYNRIIEIPSEISQLTNLSKLNLSKLCFFGNKINKIPKEIGQLTNLKFIYLASNQICAVPKEISNLTNLQWLFLNNNKQNIEIPNEIFQLISIDNPIKKK